MYDYWLDATHPGTDIKVIPDKVVPIIPYAITNKGEFLFPKKKVLLLSFLPVINDMINKIRK